MVERTNLSRTQQQARSTSSMASVRDFDDKHLLQEITEADVFHSETPSNFERFQMVGLTAVPMKQKKEDKKQNQQSSGGNQSEGDWNHDQPQGESAEAVMMYMNGNRDHPVGIVDDRRVRPFNFKAGETALYSASGTGQMVLHTDDGTYIVSLDNKGYDPEGGEGGSGGGSGGESGEGGGEEKERIVSLRHVKKEKQKREIKEGEEPEDHVHEGKKDQVNTEIRASAKKIEILDGETVIAVYTKEDKSWKFSGFKKLDIEVDEEITVTSPKVTVEATDSMLIECTAVLDIKGKPINFNGGGPTIPPFTVPG